ncbi:MAG: succinate dehydrogenase, hydrophobic membrane anchor protein [Deltaproteobacteria bacterium]
MHFLTARKQATGLGAAHAGTERHWVMTISSVALAVLTPLFVWQVAPLFGQTLDTVLTAFSAPFRAVITGLMILLGFHHLAMGMRIMLEDYAHGETRKFLVIGTYVICFVAAATGLFALARIAL